MKFYNAAAPNPRRVRIFLAEKGVEIPRQDLDLAKGESRTPEFLAKNSLAGTPILELDDGTVLAESVAICRYLESLYPEPALMGSDAQESAPTEMWNRLVSAPAAAPAVQDELYQQRRPRAKRKRQYNLEQMFK